MREGSHVGCDTHLFSLSGSVLVLSLVKIDEGWDGAQRDHTENTLTPSGPVHHRSNIETTSRPDKVTYTY